MTMPGGWNVDSDGFLVGADQAPKSVIAAPQTVAVPDFFKGCSTLDEAALLVMNELTKPYSSEQHGVDEMYRRLSMAMIVVMAKYAGVTP